MEIIHKLLNNHSKTAAKWGQDACVQLIAKMDGLKVPAPNENNILNPVPPNKNKVVNAIGFKRKEMLKFK